MSQISGWDLFRKQRSKEEELDDERQGILMAAFKWPDEMTEEEKKQIE